MILHIDVVFDSQVLRCMHCLMLMDH